MYTVHCTPRAHRLLPRSVAARSDKNLMSCSNLAVCFGPTLLRPERETVASILDLKFYNVLVETLLDHYEQIFEDAPPPPDHNGALRYGPCCTRCTFTLLPIYIFIYLCSGRFTCGNVRRHLMRDIENKYRFDPCGTLF